VESGGNFEDYVTFLFCRLFGPVNHGQNWKGWERSGEKGLIISDNQTQTCLIITINDTSTGNKTYYRQIPSIPEASATAERVFSFTGSATSERVFSFAGLTLSDLRKSLLQGTLEAIMWSEWGSPSIPLGRGDVHITHPELCE
jgi:hypothetical protein